MSLASPNTNQISATWRELSITPPLALCYHGKRDLFSTLIKNAKAKVEEQLEESLYRLGNNSGVIFNLKNNYGWRDTVEVKNDNEISKVDELLEEIKNVANKKKKKRVYSKC